MAYLLDTDTCIWAIRGRDPVRSSVAAQSPDDLAISAMTLAELSYGAINSSDPSNAFSRLERFVAAGISILPFDADAARAHAEIRYRIRAQPIGANDLVIASVAVSRGHTLVTSNLREFSRVPGLSCIDWMRPAE